MLVEKAGHSVTAAAGILNIPAGEALARFSRRTDVRRPRCPHIIGTLEKKSCVKCFMWGKFEIKLPKFYRCARPSLKTIWRSIQSRKLNGALLMPPRKPRSIALNY
jgi:hypothetical protein